MLPTSPVPGGTTTIHHVPKQVGVVTAVTQGYKLHSNLVEWMSWTIEASIWGLMHQENADPGQWFLYMPRALAAPRQTPLANLPMSPHYMVYGQHPVVPAQLALGSKSREPPMMAMEQVIEGLKSAPEKVCIQQLQNHEANKRRYDERVKQTPLELEDWVYKYAPLDPTATGQSHKTAGSEDRPYQILSLPNDCMVTMTKHMSEKGVAKCCEVHEPLPLLLDGAPIHHTNGPPSFEVVNDIESPLQSTFALVGDDYRSRL